MRRHVDHPLIIAPWFFSITVLIIYFNASVPYYLYYPFPNRYRLVFANAMFAWSL